MVEALESQPRSAAARNTRRPAAGAQRSDQSAAAERTRGRKPMLMFALLFATVLCDVAGQVCFKLGVGHEAPGTRPARRVGRFLGDLIGSRWIVAGVAVYVVEFIVWFAALTLAPLSVAFP